MLGKLSPQQTAIEMVSLEGLGPKDHLLRKIDAVIDFSFIHARVAGLYCPDNGRPPLDPTDVQALAMTRGSPSLSWWLPDRPADDNRNQPLELFTGVLACIAPARAALRGAMEDEDIGV